MKLKSEKRDKKLKDNRKMMEYCKMNAHLHSWENGRAYTEIEKLLQRNPWSISADSFFFRKSLL